MTEATVSMAGREDGPADHQTTDQTLVEAFRNGDETAFDRLFRKHQDTVFSFCWGMLGHEEDARDATQETFLRAYRGLRRFRGEAAFTTWLFRIAVHAVQQLDQRRRRQRTLPLSLTRESPDLPPDLLEGRLTQIVRAERIRSVFQELSTDHRTALVLRYYRDLSYEEMARVLHLSVAAVKARLHRSRQAFYRVYCGRFGEEEI